ncbi:hypothetical protein [Propionibacterium freudenreichii]|uniref:hypothetical protein n=1 Tax=Propionibacterium freudenreichii TaxID=1744 RepID=UPI00254D2097|nr:hypothetical protein [Propionibacterium freudenreichii]MDK9674323.1 hypothetical protein [Propionibacterium freudenreichii]
MRRTAIVGAVAATAVLVLAGCTGQDEAPAPTPSASSSTSTFPDPSQFSTAPSGVVDEDTEETIEPGPVPTWDDESRADAIAAAETALTAFARPDLDHDTWWSAVGPLLTTQSQQAYVSVDPANIPVKQVTGAGKLTDEESAYVGHVEVPTDVGTYTVIVIRADGASPWLVSRFTPPEGGQ